MSVATRLAVVIASHNRPELLRRALRSVVRQSRFHQIVVVDDGSDPPVDLASETDPRVELVRCAKNRGVSSARNLGLDVVRAKYVLFLDDDDVLLPWAARAAVRWTTQYSGPADAIHVGGVMVRQPGRLPEIRKPPTSEVGQIWGLDAELVRRGRTFATKQAAVIPADLLRRVGGFDVALRSRVTSELFFRLTQIAPVVGHGLPIYALNRAPHEKLTESVERRLASVAYIRDKHADLLARPDRSLVFESNHQLMMQRMTERTPFHPSNSNKRRE